MSENSVHNTEIGFVAESRGFMCSIKGLPTVRVNDIVTSETGARALITSLDDEFVTATMLDGERVMPGDRFMRSDANYLFHVDERLFGRIISPSGVARDSGESIGHDGHTLNIDRIAPGISERTRTVDPCLTGTGICDILIPLGRGQRQLIYGPPKSGKRDFVQQVLINQHRLGAVCIYVVCGRSPEEIRKLSRTILDEQHAPNTIIIASSSDDPSSLIAITPSVAFAVAEVFVEQGKNVCMVVDDLGMHAKYLRELALFQKRLPGRESYPGDIFYQHAHLMERSGAFKNGGTLTLLPILETETESTRDLISTNLIACTDGNFAFSAAKHAAGIFPAIDMDDSITRSGRETQTLLQKQLSTKLNQLLGWYKNQVAYSDFTAVSDTAVQDKARQGKLLHELLSQDRFTMITPDVQMLLLGLTFTSLAMEYDIASIKKYKSEIVRVLANDKTFADLRKQTSTSQDIEVFLQKLEKKISIIKKICSQA